MTKIIQTFIDKSEWGDGPWQDEPDRVQWTDKTTGLPVLVRRGNPRLGSWCGYAAVAPGHPLYGKTYGECSLNPPCSDDEDCQHSPDAILSVHGGLTYSGLCFDEEDGTGVCHIPEPGEPDDVWWFGFDCGHFGDLHPGMLALEKTAGISLHGAPNYTYRDLNYVTYETLELAVQLHSLRPDPRKRLR